MRSPERRLRPDHYDKPTLTVTTTAEPETALDALVEALVAARYQLRERGPGRVRLQVGSWLREWIADVFDVQVVPRLATWGFRATVDLEVLDAASPTRVRVRMRKVVEHRDAVPHLLTAVDVAVQALRSADHHAEAGPVGGR